MDELYYSPLIHTILKKKKYYWHIDKYLELTGPKSVINVKCKCLLRAIAVKSYDVCTYHTVDADVFTHTTHDYRCTTYVSYLRDHVILLKTKLKDVIIVYYVALHFYSTVSVSMPL